MKIAEIEIVVNVEYGGFSLDKEICEWLRDNKGWKESNNVIQKGNNVIQIVGNYCYVAGNNTEIRINPDLIECIKTLKEKHEEECENTSFLDPYNASHKVLDFSIQKIKVMADVEDVDDGIEEVIISHSIDESC